MVGDMLHISRILVLFLIVSTLIISACTPIGQSMERMGKKAHNESVIMDKRMAGYFNAKTVDAPTVYKPVDEVYCYKTLGEPDCYPEPLVGDERRLAGKQVPLYPTVAPPLVVPYVAVDTVGRTSVHSMTVSEPVAVEVQEITGSSNHPQPLVPLDR